MGPRGPHDNHEGLIICFRPTNNGEGSATFRKSGNSKLSSDTFYPRIIAIPVVVCDRVVYATNQSFTIVLMLDLSIFVTTVVKIRENFFFII